MPASSFHFKGLAYSQLLQTDLTPERKFRSDYCFSLALFKFRIMFARVFLRNKHKRIKAFLGCIIFLLSITKGNLLTKHDILKSISEILTHQSTDVCNLLNTSHIHTDSYFLHYQNLSTEIKTPSLNCYCYFRVTSVWIQAFLIWINLKAIMSGTFLSSRTSF